MAIVSKTVKIPFAKKECIESYLKELGYDVLRWAIVEVAQDNIVVSLSSVEV